MSNSTSKFVSSLNLPLYGLKDQELTELRIEQTIAYGLNLIYQGEDTSKWYSMIKRFSTFNFGYKSKDRAKAIIAQVEAISSQSTFKDTYVLQDVDVNFVKLESSTPYSDLRRECEVMIRDNKSMEEIDAYIAKHTYNFEAELIVTPEKLVKLKAHLVMVQEYFKNTVVSTNIVEPVLQPIVVNTNDDEFYDAQYEDELDLSYEYDASQDGDIPDYEEIVVTPKVDNINNTVNTTTEVTNMDTNNLFALLNNTKAAQAAVKNTVASNAEYVDSPRPSLKSRQTTTVADSTQESVNVVTIPVTSVVDSPVTPATPVNKVNTIMTKPTMSAKSASTSVSTPKVDVVNSNAVIESYTLNFNVWLTPRFNAANAERHMDSLYETKTIVKGRGNWSIRVNGNDDSCFAVAKIWSSITHTKQGLANHMVVVANYSNGIKVTLSTQETLTYVCHQFGEEVKDGYSDIKFNLGMGADTAIDRLKDGTMQAISLTLKGGESCVGPAQTTTYNGKDYQSFIVSDDVAVSFLPSTVELSKALGIKALSGSVINDILSGKIAAITPPEVTPTLKTGGIAQVIAANVQMSEAISAPIPVVTKVDSPTVVTAPVVETPALSLDDVKALIAKSIAPIQSELDDVKAINTALKNEVVNLTAQLSDRDAQIAALQSQLASVNTVVETAIIVEPLVDEVVTTTTNPDEFKVILDTFKIWVGTHCAAQVLQDDDDTLVDFKDAAAAVEAAAIEKFSDISDSNWRALCDYVKANDDALAKEIMTICPSFYSMVVIHLDALADILWA